MQPDEEIIAAAKVAMAPILFQSYRKDINTQHRWWWPTN